MVMHDHRIERMPTDEHPVIKGEDVINFLSKRNFRESQVSNKN